MRGNETPGTLGPDLHPTVQTQTPLIPSVVAKSLSRSFLHETVAILSCCLRVCVACYGWFSLEGVEQKTTCGSRCFQLLQKQNQGGQRKQGGQQAVQYAICVGHNSRWAVKGLSARCHIAYPPCSGI